MALISRDASHLVVVDLQEKLLPALPGANAMLAHAALLVEAAATLAVPTTVTEQYPNGLGATDAALSARLGDAPRVEKRAFSAARALEARLADFPQRRELVLVGAETHVCVLQTALEALELGFRVVLAADATGSRRRLDRLAALRRMERAGALVATTEMILFEWLREAGTPAFRALIPKIKALGSDPK
ncbi:isochorismatase family protein [Methylocella sp.]|uniref:isochorismatase family protein n=1 Tax=Methylocella sp. TaxID=1978226 RepID=UPI003784ABC0